MVAAASGAQAAPNAGSNMLVQLLESQRFEGVSLLADEDKVRPEQDNTDVTEWIVNPDFSDGMNGWNTGGMPYDEGYLTNDGMPYMYSDGVHGYNRTFDFTQNLTGIPNGAYSLSVQIISSAGVPTVTLHLNSSIEKAEYGIGQDRIEIATSIEAWADDQDANRVTTSEVLVVDGNLTMGINRHNGREGYLYFDNFRLTYVNDGADKAQETLSTPTTVLFFLSKDKANVPVPQNKSQILFALPAYSTTVCVKTCCPSTLGCKKAPAGGHKIKSPIFISGTCNMTTGSGS